MILGDILPKEKWPAVVEEWIRESYEDTPDGERRALNDLIHIAQRTMRQPTSLAEARKVLRAQED